jgi:hypothetical protein
MALAIHPAHTQRKTGMCTLVEPATKFRKRTWPALQKPSTLVYSPHLKAGADKTIRLAFELQINGVTFGTLCLWFLCSALSL